MHRLHQRQEAQVEAQDLVLGVIHDPCDLLWMQARVDGVQHPARAADAVVKLEVPIAVPRQRGDAVAEVQGLTFQRVRRTAERRATSAHV